MKASLRVCWTGPIVQKRTSCKWQWGAMLPLQNPRSPLKILMKKDLGIFGLLLALCLVTTTQNPKFLSPVNLTNLANIIGLFGIFSLGTGLIIITGGIDLSVGSMVALTGVLLSMALREWHWAWPLAALFVVLVAVILGYFHNVLITKFNMQPFIVTLCGLLLYRGIARFVARDET